LGADNFYFLLSLVNFHKTLVIGQKIKFLIGPISIALAPP